MRPSSQAEEYLARLVHCIRPAWDVAGIRAAFSDRPELDLPELIGIALAAAYDESARTPAVIRSRSHGWMDSTTTGTSRLGAMPQPPSIRELVQAPRQTAEVAKRGAELARAELRKRENEEDLAW